MADTENTPISPIIGTKLNNWGFAIKRLPYNSKRKHYSTEQGDEYTYSGKEPLSTDERLKSAVNKFNAANELRIVAETNYFAELYHDYNLLQEYNAYKNPELNDLTFIPVSEDTVSASYKKKQVEIKCKILENGSKQYKINFGDDSQISYVLFSKGGKADINGEEFEMPIGTILENKSVDGRVFSKLIQTPDMRREVINMPEVIENVEQILNSYNMFSPSKVVDSSAEKT